MNGVVYAVARCLALWLSYIRLNSLQKTTVDGRVCFVKTRRRITRFLIPPGNLLMRITGGRSEVLGESDWRDWEWRVSKAGPKALLHKGDGDSLDTLLRSMTCEPAERLLAIRLALRALEALHQRQVAWDDGQVRSLSHGDATCGNVSVDLPQQTATWFDFDTRHRREISELDRFTDDYRALIFSAACVLDESLYPSLAELCWECIPKTQGKHFQALLATAGQRTTLFELAQAPLTRKQLCRLLEALSSRHREVAQKREGYWNESKASGR
ncbi:hypothetical protein SH139x_005734 [Planctomycetaceae bacterium SH139]